jgi:hypothetical protein
VAQAATVVAVRRVVGVLLVTVLVPALALAGCSKKRQEGSPAQAAAWFKAVANQKPTVSTTTTAPVHTTTTIPPTTSTIAPLARLALSKAFLEAAEARRLAQERCQQLGTGKRKSRC